MAPAEPADELPLFLRFRNGEVIFALTDQVHRLPFEYPIDAPFIRSAHIFGLLEEFKLIPVEHQRAFMEEQVTDTDTLHDLFVAAAALGFQGLADLCAQMTADAVKGRTVEEVKHLLGIVDVGMTPEEELKLQHDNEATLCLR